VISQAHVLRGAWFGEAQKGIDAVRRHQQSGSKAGRDETDPDGRSYSGVGPHLLMGQVAHAVSTRRNRTDYALPLRWRCLQPGQQQGRRWPSSSSS
jgi:hypothetical protein